MKADIELEFITHLGIPTDKINCEAEYNQTRSTVPIERLPYNGYSSYLISKIMLIEYEKNNLTKLIKKYDKYNHNKVRKDLNSILLEEKPIVLKSFMSENIKSIDNNAIINFVFPETPCIKTIDDNNNQEKDIKNEIPNQSQNVVFSFNIPLDNKKQICVNYFANIYYDQVIIENKQYYCPKAICFISDYPYFMNYHALSEYYCRNISKYPLSDLWLYQLVYLPSPINSSIQLIYQNCSEGNKNSIDFPQLSGYPLFNFNLAKLFDILSIELIIETFIYTFFEKDIIFFSEDIEVLNIVMYIFAQLNYPLNDSPYFFHVISVSLDTFLEGTNPYVTKTFTSLLGVNAKYDKSYNEYVKKEDYLIVDIDKNRKMTPLGKQNILFKTIKSLKNIGVYFLKKMPMLINNQNLNALDKSINTLFSKLKQNLENIDDSIKKVSFFNFNLKNEQTNKNIQELFYSFIIDILAFFTSFCKIEYPNEINNKYSIVYDPNHNKQQMKRTKETKDFLNMFSECSKTNCYFFNFIQHHDALNVLKIPLIFLEQFICKELPRVSLFKTIDMYYKIKQSTHQIILHSIDLKQNYLGINEELNKTVWLLTPHLIKYIFESKINIYYITDKVNQESNNNQGNSGKVDKDTAINQIKHCYFPIRDKITIQMIKANKVSTSKNMILYLYIMLFILTRKLFKQPQFQPLQLIIKVIERNKDLFSLRTYITLLINQFSKLIEEKTKPDQGINEDKICLKFLLRKIKEYNIIPNEELLISLNSLLKHRHILTCNDLSGDCFIPYAIDYNNQNTNDQSELKSFNNFVIYETPVSHKLLFKKDKCENKENIPLLFKQTRTLIQKLFNNELEFNEEDKKQLKETCKIIHNCINNNDDDVFNSNEYVVIDNNNTQEDYLKLFHEIYTQISELE